MNMTVDMDRLKKQMDFIKEVDKEKQIIRQTYLADGSRKESDAEHAWHLAIMAMLMCEYSNEKVDAYHVMKMVLVHDLIEIDAGDTYAYDVEGNKTKRERELKAADRIFKLLPEDQAASVRALWDEFEDKQTPEAKFANTLDKIQPIMLNDASDGKAWVEHGVVSSQVYNRNAKTPEGSEILWNYFDNTYIKPNIEKGRLKK